MDRVWLMGWRSECTGGGGGRPAHTWRRARPGVCSCFRPSSTPDWVALPSGNAGGVSSPLTAVPFVPFPAAPAHVGPSRGRPPCNPNRFARGRDPPDRRAVPAPVGLRGPAAPRTHQAGGESLMKRVFQYVRVGVLSAGLALAAAGPVAAQTGAGGGNAGGDMGGTASRGGNTADT